MRYATRLQGRPRASCHKVFLVCNASSEQALQAAPEESPQTDPSTSIAGNGDTDGVKGSRSTRVPVARDRNR
jgi:hypothetical protein